MELNCEQEAIDNNWELPRTNSCHIAVTNTEMGELRDAQLQMNFKLDVILGASSLVYGAIIVGLIAIAIKRIFGNNKPKA